MTRTSDSGEAQFQLFDATSSFLRVAAGERGLVVVLDDAHWADAATLLLLRHLVRELGRDRLSVESRRWLELASLVGSTFACELLEGLGAVDRLRHHRRIAQTLEREWQESPVEGANVMARLASQTASAPWSSPRAPATPSCWPRCFRPGTWRWPGRIGPWSGWTWPSGRSGWPARWQRRSRSCGPGSGGPTRLGTGRLRLGRRRGRPAGKPRALAQHPSAKGPVLLSRREREVAALVAQGLTNREIARSLFLPERTAENHVQHILTKLRFGSRAQIAAWAVSEGLSAAGKN